ncbi:MAG: hypothetical protein ABJC74_03030 [Gemmatimonadota bacterium]
MPPSRLAAALAVVLLAACHIEDHTPAGSRQDETAIREVVARYIGDVNQRDWVAARSRFIPTASVEYAHASVSLDRFLLDMRRQSDSLSTRRELLRLDLRQVGDMAAGWGAYRLGPGEAIAMSHFVLRRTPEGWRIAHLAVARLPAGVDP